MKIFKDNAVYVQKNDIVFLNHCDIGIPASIFEKVFNEHIVIINDSNRYQFVEFTAEHEIEFFKKIDWIIDYESVKELSEEELIQMGETIAVQMNEMAKKYNSMTEEQKKENAHMFDEQERLEFKMYSVRDIIWFKQGFLKFRMPGEEKGIAKLLKKFKKKK